MKRMAFEAQEKYLHLRHRRKAFIINGKLAMND
jgi:hypothetical protein